MDPYKRHRRLGRWYVSGQEQHTYPGRFEEIQRHVVILRAAPMLMRDACEFMGRSPDFEIVEEGEEIPVYRPITEGDSFRWEQA